MRFPCTIDIKIKAKLYVTIVSLAGMCVIGTILKRFGSDDLYRFVFYLVLSGFAAGLKVSLPGIRGTMSVRFLFVFIGIADLTASEAMTVDDAALAIGGLEFVMREDAAVDYSHADTSAGPPGLPGGVGATA